MSVNFYFPTRLVSGPNCLEEKRDLLATLGKRALIITGGSGAKKSGALDEATAALAALGVEYEIYSGIGANPAIENCFEAAQQARAFGAEFVLAIGGGSVLDASKAAVLYAANDYAGVEEIYSVKPQRALPLVCVGTTAGTGSEADGAAVITNTEKKKKSFRYDITYPKVSFCDPRYTVSLPLRQTVSTALDALCHGVESWYNTSATDLSRAYSQRCVELVWPRLKQIAEGGFAAADMELRSDLLYGSVIGGMAISIAGTGYPHPAGYLLTEVAGVPHGAACGIYLSEYLGRVFETRADVKQQLCATVGSLDEMLAVLKVLTAHNIKLSSEMGERTMERVMAAANFAKTPTAHGESEAREIAFQFVDPQQSESVTGSWDFVG